MRDEPRVQCQRTTTQIAKNLGKIRQSGRYPHKAREYSEVGVTKKDRHMPGPVGVEWNERKIESGGVLESQSGHEHTKR